MLFWNELPFCLGTLRPTFSQPTATTNSDLTLVRIIPNTFGIYFFSQYDIESVPVSLFKNVLENIIYRKA